MTFLTIFAAVIPNLNWDKLTIPEKTQLALDNKAKQRLVVAIA